MSEIAFTSFVAVGDSFTEGMSDALPGGGFRGWADLLAARLAAARPGLHYANLAVRGKLIAQIAEEQVPLAARMGADLISFAGGGNDLMRPRCDVDAVCERVERAVERLASAAHTVLLFRPVDPSRRLHTGGRPLARWTRMVELVSELGDRHQGTVVDLFGARVFDDPRLWAEDRIHLNAEGHRRVAEAAAQALGLTATFDWAEPLPDRVSDPWWDRRRADLRRATSHVAPWIGRRLTGRSSGDGLPPKRPDLAPLDVPPGE